MVNQVRVSVATGDLLDVRSFQVTQAMSRLFRIEIEVTCTNPDVDFDGVIGLAADFSLATATSSHSWSGICVEMDQIRTDHGNLSTYTLVIAPRAYLLTQRKNYRIFQYKSELEIVQQLLGEWDVPFRTQVDPAAHVARKFRAQYNESDFDFISRMLEDAGISFYFEGSSDGTTMVLDDEPQDRALSLPLLQFHDRPGATDARFVSQLVFAQRTRPGKTTIGDVEYRRASTAQPRLSATGGLQQEKLLEQFDHEPGAFLFVGGGGGNTPAADDRGTARTDEVSGGRKTNNRLLGRRQDAMRVAFESNVLALSPGATLSVVGHPHASITESDLLVQSASIEGNHDDDWRVEVESVSTDAAFRPDLVAPRPRVRGLESATVVGPGGEEIHTDEYGRVRVHFHWDRESQRDEKSSCWLPVNQPWAGAGFGGVSLPRIGQEVLVEFLGGDPDRPVVLGRVFTKSNKPAYPMPEGMKVTGIVGKSSPAMITGAAGEMSTWQFTDMFARDTSFGPFKAQPPKPVSPYSSDNAFLMGDAQGEDITFIQARKDLNFVVKNAWKTVVGNYRATFVGNDDMLKVRNKQKIEVKENQELRVVQNQFCEVGKLRDERVDKNLALSVLSDAGVKTEGGAEYKAPKEIIVQSEEAIVFKVGNSSITITKPEIVISSAKVDINPDS
jgi:type VI secretion system secreted protein VgrG